MRDAVSEGRQCLDDAAVRRLRDLTQALLASKPEAQREHQRFLDIAQRSIAPPGRDLDAWLRGKTVLVTGGTGCIGSPPVGPPRGFLPPRRCRAPRVWPPPGGKMLAPPPPPGSPGPQGGPGGAGWGGRPPAGGPVTRPR